MVGISLREYQNIEGGKCIPTTEVFLRLKFIYRLDDRGIQQRNRYRYSKNGKKKLKDMGGWITESRKDNSERGFMKWKKNTKR